MQHYTKICLAVYLSIIYLTIHLSFYQSIYQHFCDIRDFNLHCFHLKIVHADAKNSLLVLHTNCALIVKWAVLISISEAGGAKPTQPTYLIYIAFVL